MKATDTHYLVLLHLPHHRPNKAIVRIANFVSKRKKTVDWVTYHITFYLVQHNKQKHYIKVYIIINVIILVVVVVIINVRPGLYDEQEALA